MSLTAVGPTVDDDLPRRLGEELEGYLALRRDGGLAPELGDALADLALGGGKRLRPTFAWWGWRAAGGAAGGPEADALVRALVALELLQCCALIHDDVMDRSATRRGRPTAHRVFAARHRRERWAGDATHYGDCAAILVGDLALAWADDALVRAGLPGSALTRAWEPWQAMRTEMMAGQHLDLLGGATRSESVAAGLRVARLKTAAYTVERPLHLGAAVADAPAAVIDALRAYGRDIGVAFQLRDDLLGSFGDARVTGKPVGEDLREGKRTPLMATALGLARTAGRADAVRALRDCLEGGATDHELAHVRALLHDLGAVAVIEERITALTTSGLRALDAAALVPAARDRLVALAEQATARTR
ncbi:polyprenyl synthetase family protein [Actinosynnema sp. NPDC047251]|uniref:Polyprenyl synthetase n=1 Tax=Saccharothrix espanaensis (strain ATCC 51144 / DSM 44229 / JCM 9112 / NBRC 15066 / NRRL 15764) TaxID=1179773 RepID=K0JWV9_SACES|nr:polyprenyl synthetase family protein [Saccharothrix espanaensis]CCH32350.1 Polyprenyl synthetase [Saccharothrix espanaensis DSM 44229]